MRGPTWPRHAATGIAGAALCFALAACGGNAVVAEPSPSATPTTKSPTPTKTHASHEPTNSPSTPQTSSPTNSTTQSPTATTSSPELQGSGLLADLLPASELPGLNDQWRWQEQSTARDDGQNLPSSCMVSGFRSIGATGIYRRDYTGPGNTGFATNMVARFADAQSARRTFMIWLAWHEGCEQRLQQSGDWSPRRIEVSDAFRVPTSRGQALWWMASYGPVEGEPDLQYFEPNGVLRVGRTISLVVERTAGQDYNYPPGTEPVVLALKASADRLG